MEEKETEGRRGDRGEKRSRGTELEREGGRDHDGSASVGANKDRVTKMHSKLQ